ncbi:MAG: hypothetical protein O2960_21420, partial [Verrucomicrobia bacterium]|nr:hypothetical protein [Verrucomicrobiota bacterium]
MGDAEITKETFLSELEIRARRGQSVGTPEDQKSILEDMIQLEMLVAKATAAGLDRDPEIARQYKQMLATGFEQRERARLAPVGEPEDGAIELFYEQQRKQFTIPEKIHVAMILTKVPSKAGAEQVQVRILAFSPAVVPHGYEGEGVAVV